jgi:hypothetical protein
MTNVKTIENDVDGIVSIGQAAEKVLKSAGQALVERKEASTPAPISDAAAIFQIIERAALNPNVDIDKMERLMAMHERMTATKAKAAYSAALARMQVELPVIDRKGKITIRDKSDAKNVIQSTPYALWEDINEAIKPVLAKHGFALSFRTGLAGDGKLTVTGILSHEDGHQEETTMVLPHDSTGSKNAVQAVGSTTSYGKRYTAGALLNLTSRGEDDDGKSGGGGMITEAQAAEIRALIEETGTDIAKFCDFLKVEAIPEIPASEFVRAKTALEAKRRKSA